MANKREWRQRSKKWRKLYRRLSQHWVDAINDLSEREAAALKSADFWKMRYGSADKAGTDAFDKLLAWQRQVREALPGADHVYTIIPSTTAGQRQNCIAFTMDDWDKLRRAIEGEETQAK